MTESDFGLKVESMKGRVGGVGGVAGRKDLQKACGPGFFLGFRFRSCALAAFFSFHSLRFVMASWLRDLFVEYQPEDDCQL